MKEEISNQIISRAVDLWCKKLFNPVFDNGDESEAGAIGGILATVNIQNAKNKIDDLRARVEVFRKTLTESLIKTRGKPSSSISERRGIKNRGSYGEDG